jgi:hypothetical protein
MSDDIQRLEHKIQEMAERLRRLEEHVFAGAAPPAPPVAEPKSPAPSAEPAPDLKPRTAFSVMSTMTLAGRSFIVLGGAFLLRWLTQSGALPEQVGSVIGMLYGLVWLALADVTARRNRRASATFLGVTSALIALPLVFEITTKSGFLSPTVGSVTLAAYVVLALMVAGRHGLRVLAWAVAVPAVPIAFALSSESGVLTPFLLTLLTLGLFTLWIGYRHHWTTLATVMAMIANVGILMLILDHAKNIENTGVLEMSLWESLVSLIGLVAVYFGSYCFRETLAVVFIGLGGIAVVANARGQSMLPVGLLCIVLSAACYSAAYGFLPRLDPNRRNFLFFTLLGLATYLLGCELIFGGGVAAIIFAVTALIAGVIARPIRSPVLYLHGAAYVLAAIAASGMLAAIIDGFIGSPLPTSPWATVAVLCALAVSLCYPWLPRPEGRVTDVFVGRRAVEVLAVLAVLGLGLAVVAVFGRWLPSPEDAGYRGAIAAARTTVLALSALALAWSSRRARYHYMAWPVYVVLALGALKILLEDVRTGGYSIMFVAFAVYGGVLILAPRLLRSAGTRRKSQSTK